MNLKYMIELQGGLMEHIKKVHKLEVIPFNDTVLAFLVELGELANEIKSFKYWSKNAKPTERTLEEYIDGLHFALQKGILLEVDASEIVSDGNFRKNTINEQLFDLYMYAIDIQDSGSLQTRQFYWSQFINAYLQLGEMLGFTPEQIQYAYIEKNRINHERQASGY